MVIDKIRKAIYQYRIHERFAPLGLYYQFSKPEVDAYLNQMVSAGILQEVYVLYNDADLGEGKVYHTYTEIPFGEVLSNGLTVKKENIHTEYIFRAK